VLLAPGALAQLGSTTATDDAPSGFVSGKAPTPKKSDSDPRVLWGYFCVLVILGAVIGTNLIPSKRGHQD
jgi:hypothetical protein